MPTLLVARPDAGEYPSLFSVYVDRVPEGDVLALLRRQIDTTSALWSQLTEGQADYRYAPAKWSTRDVIGHLADAERIMTYRALCFARGERKELPGFDEDAYVSNAGFGRRSLAELLDELRAVRAATIAFFEGLSDEELVRGGSANNRTYTVRGLAYVIAGHELHHQEVYRERYLPGIADA